MKGSNPIRKPETSDGQVLAVQEIFPTIQGEGCNAGVPAVFLRLGGCNLACDFCDTEFESFAEQPLASVVQQVIALAGTVIKLVVITGGEPFRQNIVPLCEELIASGFQVQIETNGTLWREVPQAVEIICSPKVSAGKYHSIRPDLVARITAFKFIVSDTHPDYGYVPDVGQGNIPIYVQPMDEGDAQKNKANQKLATMLAMLHGYRLSLQLHKILEIR